MVSYPAPLEGEDCLDAAVVELDTLSDTVRAAAEDNDLLPVRRRRLVRKRVGGIFVRRVEVRGVRLELGRRRYRPDLNTAVMPISRRSVRMSHSVTVRFLVETR